MLTRRCVVHVASLVLVGLPAISPVQGQTAADSAIADSTIIVARSLFGNYKRADGSLVSVGRGVQSVFLMDYRTGERDDLRLGRADTIVDPARGMATLSLQMTGSDTVLSIRGSRATWTATRLLLTRTDVTFQDGGVTLSGTLWEPVGRGPFPAIVLLHGAGEETRYAMRQYPYFFVSRGYAVLTYDKRGSGKSTGDWHPWVAGIDVLSGDAAAAVELLRNQHEIRADRVGLLGISNGAWVAVRTATHTDNVAFVIPIVGGGGSLWGQELYRIHNEGRTHDLSKPDEAALDHFMSSLYSAELFDSLPRGAAIVKLDSLRASAKGAAWFAETPLAVFGDTPSTSLFDVGREAWRRELSYDANADLRSLRQPMLAILGGADQDVPSASVAAQLRGNYPHAGADHRTILIIPGASHYLLLRSDARRPTVDRFDPLLFTTLTRWLTAEAR